jgi:hypothetical protein
MIDIGHIRFVFEDSTLKPGEAEAIANRAIRLLSGAGQAEDSRDPIAGSIAEAIQTAISRKAGQNE